MDSHLLAELPIQSHEDIVTARQKVRTVTQELGYSLLDQTRIITAVSELARNVVIHADGGTMSIFRCQLPRDGVCIVFADQGPGIQDVERALQSGYSTAGSLGLGLPGAQRLSDSMKIDSSPGRGTTVTICKWL